jgi:hypothetical protein
MTQKGIAIGCLLITMTKFGPSGTQTFQSMFPNEVKDICEAWATYCEHIKG